MNLPFQPAHSPFGGSVAARILGCPASVGLVAKVPEHLRRTSSYADRGTALHDATAFLIDESATLENLVGRMIGNYTITNDDVENTLRPVCDYVNPLLDRPGAYFHRDLRVTFPGISGAFGTLDLIVHIGCTVYLIDFKFGSGVRVLALYPDGVLNSQLMFYAAAARHSLPEFFADAEAIILTILQPNSTELDAEMVSSVEVTNAELDAFIAVYRAACAEALSESPRLERGAWCKFCPARPICPLHTAPLLDLGRFVPPTLRDTLVASLAAPTNRAAYLQVLAKGLNLIDAVKDISSALREQARAALENGDSVPGYALSAGRAERHWRDESVAIAALENLGLTRNDIIAEELRSPKQVEIRAKARGLKVPPELIVSRRSGTSLVRSENARAPVPGRGELVRSFSAALDAFQGGRQP
jgi:hypothetical protein